MPSDELSSIPGLQANYQRALDGKLGISSLRALADADQRAIYAALANTRPRPSLKRIEAWQDVARDALEDAANRKATWQTAASFAVIFAQRQVDGGWERRLEAEQTEVEPEAEPQHWPGWDCRPLCDWMLEQLEPGRHHADVTTEETALGPARAPGSRAELRIDTAMIIDAVHELHLVRGGNLVAAPGEALIQPVHLQLTVSDGRSGQQLRAAVWFRRQASHGWSPHEPVAVSVSGQAEFDLSSVPPGAHEIRLLAWATDAGANLAAITLPTLTFSPDAEDDSRPAVAHASS